MALVLTGSGVITGLSSQLADANMPAGSVLQVVSTTKTLLDVLEGVIDTAKVADTNDVLDVDT